MNANEIVITTNKLNQHIDPQLHIWGWEVPVYLFFGGLAAGILIITALAIIYDKEKELPYSYNKLALFAPIGLTLGMIALFFDLEYKLHVFRFYTTFQVTSPMSWGSWILQLFYPASILVILGTIKKGWPWIYEKIKNIPMMEKIILFSERNLKTIAYISIPIGVSLGIYTGILLSAYVARPFWNSSILGPIFLVSGLSTALALVLILTKDKHEQHFISKVDLGVIITEITLIALFIIGMQTGSAIKIESIGMILGGAFTTKFWIFFVGIGLFTPMVLEILELKGKAVPKMLPASLVLFGGLIFRFIMVSAGQVSTWVNY
ncbi:MAG: nitrite reductase [Epsilonproteobacteria bacterium]|nr:MAG: nitrite reductase [Campylobacterota bacterium]RLA66939.1 MAG: nitrite reductase [Campylobacterota bacterium]